MFTEVYFIGFNGFSGQIYFSDWFTNLYNTFWSSWPMLINFTLDKDVDRKTALNYPVLYHGAYSNAYLNLKVFWKWISLAIFHGAIIFWVPVLVKFLLIKDEPDKN